MKLYDLLNNTAAVEEQYWLLKKTLQEHLAVEPSEEIENWYRSWKQINTMSQVDAFN
ncbi:bacterial transcriptional activator domain-containing protein [Lysinibacillus sp. OL1_EC]|uniref:bacterial transcriptional activator domain-containing protein n=1 Tax=unclassified Lysinibacillus TaxID=2636778 RepID=UPI001D112CDF|nr:MULTISPECIES: bacterial transcriptional activator domain-containing protein [unclassified Lysinibacillus]MCM0626874.1 bacterial transcriptional activator domain-containing protein [Lysinibacillus sp. OL1_EC]